MTDVPKLRGLPIIVLGTLGVAAVAARESVNGLATVARTATGVSVVLVLLLVGAIVVRVIARRSASVWPRRSLVGLAAITSLLVVLVAVATYRGHTASRRFADQAARFPLPAGYRPVPASLRDAQNANEPEHAARAWLVPPGADPCVDIKRAFAAWTDQRRQSFNRGSSCAVATTGGTDKSEVSLSRDGSTVLLEMWLEGSTLFQF